MEKKPQEIKKFDIQCRNGCTGNIMIDCLPAEAPVVIITCSVCKATETFKMTRSRD